MVSPEVRQIEVFLPESFAPSVNYKKIVVTLPQPSSVCIKLYYFNKLINIIILVIHNVKDKFIVILAASVIE